MEINPIGSLKKLTVSQTGKSNNEPSLLDIESEEDELSAEGKFADNLCLTSFESINCIELS